MSRVSFVYTFGCSSCLCFGEAFDWFSTCCFSLYFFILTERENKKKIFKGCHVVVKCIQWCFQWYHIKMVYQKYLFIVKYAVDAPSTMQNATRTPINCDWYVDTKTQNILVQWSIPSTNNCTLTSRLIVLDQLEVVPP